MPGASNQNSSIGICGGLDGYDESESLSLITSYLARDTSLPVFPWKGAPYVRGGGGGSVTRSHLPSVVMCQGCHVDCYFRRIHAVQRRTMYISPQSASLAATRENELLFLPAHHYEAIPLILILSLRRPSGHSGLLTGFRIVIGPVGE